MKKLVAIIMGLVSLIALASCNNGETDYTLDSTVKEKELYKNWMAGVEFSTERIQTENYDVNNTRFEIFLPTDIKTASRYTVDSIESYYTGHSVRAAISYWCFFNISNVTSEITNQVSSVYESTIAPSYTGIVETKDYVKNWQTNLATEDLNKLVGEQNGKTRSLVVLYAPCKINYYLAKEGSEAQHVLETYAIFPVYSELLYLDTPTEGANLKLEDDHEIAKNFTNVTLNIANGLLN